MKEGSIPPPNNAIEFHKLRRFGALTNLMEIEQEGKHETINYCKPRASAKFPLFICPYLKPDSRGCISSLKM
jgi:hypothetical protein